MLLDECSLADRAGELNVFLQSHVSTARRHAPRGPFVISLRGSALYYLTDKDGKIAPSGYRTHNYPIHGQERRSLSQRAMCLILRPDARSLRLPTPVSATDLLDFRAMSRYVAFRIQRLDQPLDAHCLRRAQKISSPPLADETDVSACSSYDLVFRLASRTVYGTRLLMEGITSQILYRQTDLSR